MTDNREEAGSHYKRFVNSHRRIQGGLQKVSSDPMPARVHPKYHRNANAAIDRALRNSDEIKRVSSNDTPSPHKYQKPTIFDPEKAQIVKAGYRAGHHDNPNQIINNNTQFRIFNMIKPQDKSVPPLENLNLNPNKWKPKVTYYYQDNKGDITGQPDPSPYEGYMNPHSTKNERDKRLTNSKRMLNNYLNLVNTDMRMMNQKYREKMTSKSAMTKLPEHKSDAYAVTELARSGPTNKSIIEYAKHDKLKHSDAMGNKKYSISQYYPVLDVQKRKIIQKETNLDRLESKRYRTIDVGDDNKRSYSTNNYHILTPKHPKPLEFQRHISSLEVNGNTDKVGSVTYRDNNTKSVYPLNEKTNVKQQITSVYERNKKVMKHNYPQIAPVFKLAVPRVADIENNPLKKVDATDYFGTRKHNNYPAMALAKNRPEFMDLLNMSKKLDMTARIGKNG